MTEQPFLDATMPHLDVVWSVARRMRSDPAAAEDLVSPARAAGASSPRPGRPGRSRAAARARGRDLPAERLIAWADHQRLAPPQLERVRLGVTVVEVAAGLLLVLGLATRLGALLALVPAVFLFFVCFANDRWLPELPLEDQLLHLGWDPLRWWATSLRSRCRSTSTCGRTQRP